MSKSKKVKYDMTPYKKYQNYLENYDTSGVDTTLGNLTDYASNASQQLNNMGNYNFSVDGSDEARQRAENATYQAYMDKLTPQFERQTANLESSLINKGLPVGSEAYQRAMSDLQEQQNNAMNQAAYQSVLAGQDAYSRSLNNEIAAGSFGNAAQQSYISQLLSALQGSPSGYENQQNIFNVGAGKSDLKYAQDKANANRGGGWGTALGTIGGAAIGGAFGGLGGAKLGAGLGGAVGGMFG